MARKRISPKQAALLEDSSESSFDLDTYDIASLASEHGSKHSLNSSGGSLNSSWSSLQSAGNMLMKPIEKVKQLLPHSPMKMPSVLPKNYAELMEDYSSEDLSGALDRVTLELDDADVSTNGSCSASDQETDQEMIAEAFRDDNISLNESKAKLYDSFDASLWTLKGELILIDPPSDQDEKVLEKRLAKSDETREVSPKRRVKKYTRRKKQSEETFPSEKRKQRGNPRRTPTSRLNPTRQHGRMVNRKLPLTSSPANNLKILQESIRKISLENNHANGRDERYFDLDTQLSMRGPRRKLQRRDERPAVLAFDNRSNSISDSEDLGRITNSTNLSRDIGHIDINIKPRRERVQFTFDPKDLKDHKTSGFLKNTKHKSKVTMTPMVSNAFGLEVLPGL